MHSKLKFFIKKKKGGRIRVRKKERQHCGDLVPKATVGRKNKPRAGSCLGLGPRWEGGGSLRRKEGPCPVFSGGSDRAGAQTGRRHSWTGQSSVWVQLTHRDIGVCPPLCEPGTPPTGSSSKYGTPRAFLPEGGPTPPSCAMAGPGTLVGGIHVTPKSRL